MLNDLRHGKGKLYSKNGKIIYYGEFFEDKFEGNGKYIYNNGDYYIGKWKDSKRNGKGILIDKKGKIKYIGIFIDDQCK